MPIKRSIRKSQLISPWGIGQMINFPGEESLMVAGLDAWEQQYETAPNGKEEFIIYEDRLQKRLKVDHFRLPPDYREQSSGILNPGLHVPCVRFPLWHYCPKCGSMKKLSLYQSRKQQCDGTPYKKGVSCSKIPPKKRRTLIPIRFVTACEKGHMEDFPFLEWVHRGKKCTADGQLRYFIRRSTNALGAIQISCSCGIDSRTMAGSFNEGSLNKIKTCSGKTPWLGDNEATTCGNDLRVVQRGAANVYFPQIASSIFISEKKDPGTMKLLKILEENWNYLRPSEKNHLDIEKFKKVSEIKQLTKEESDRLLRLGQEKMYYENAEDITEEEFRKTEYDVLTSGNTVKSDDLVLFSVDPTSYGSPISKYFTRIAVIHKLRETRVLTGFSRLQPNDNKELSESKKILHATNSTPNWLPAIIVRGEGIFLEFREDLLETWSKKQNVQSRCQKLNSNLILSGTSQPVTPQYTLLHTFAHMLINQLGLICGYNTSSLRERIYCPIENGNLKMNGILIYTASADSEGSLGGLVKQGKSTNLSKIIVSALHKSEWCSSDPVCIESAGQGPGSCNLAACHNCALLPETSCERNNKALDRGFIIGSLGDPDLAFFGSY